jgi:hypothetical protein
MKGKLQKFTNFNAGIYSMTEGEGAWKVDQTLLAILNLTHRRLV